MNDVYGFIGAGPYWQDTNGNNQIDEEDTPHDVDFGVALNNLDGGFAFMRTLLGDLVTEGNLSLYLAANLSIESAGFVGLDDITLEVNDFTFQMNLGISLNTTFDFTQLVLDNEFVKMIKHAVRGFAVDDGSLAVDVINAVGPSGDFLTKDHTLKYMRTHSQPEFIDRSGMEMWQASGATDSYQRALEKTRDILLNHQPEPLPEKVLAQLRSIITETEGELGA